MRLRWAVGGVMMLIIALWLYKVILVPRPYWALTTDVETDVISNVLLYAQGLPIENYWLPATPAIVLLGSISRFFSLSWNDLNTIRYIGYTITLLLTLAVPVGLAARYLQNVTLPLTLTALLIPFLLPANLTYLTFYAENPFLLPYSILTLAVLGWSLTAPSSKSPYVVLLAGIITGVGITLKLLMLPLAAAGLVGYTLNSLFNRDFTSSETLLKLWRVMLLYVFAITGCLLVLLIPLGLRRILVAIFIGVFSSLILCLGWYWSRYRVIRLMTSVGTFSVMIMAGFLLAMLPARLALTQMQEHVTNLLTRAGPYGSGETLGRSDLLANIMLAVRVTAKFAPGFSLVVLGALGLCVWQLYQRRVNVREVAIGAGLASALILSLIVPFTSSTFGTLSGDPGVSTRYLLPAVACLTLLVIWLLQSPPSLHWQIGILVFVGSFVGWNVIRDSVNHYQLVANEQAALAVIRSDIDALTQELDREPLVLMGLVPYPVAAERHGVQRYAKLQRPLLDARYPSTEYLADFIEIAPDTLRWYDRVYFPSGTRRSADFPVLDDKILTVHAGRPCPDLIPGTPPVRDMQILYPVYRTDGLRRLPLADCPTSADERIAQLDISLTFARSLPPELMGVSQPVINSWLETLDADLLKPYTDTIMLTGQFIAELDDTQRDHLLTSAQYEQIIVWDEPWLAETYYLFQLN